MLAALRYREFRLLLANTFLAYASVSMQRLVVAWLVLKLTDSPAFLGVAFAARALPYLLLGAFGGTVADRLNRKRLLLTVQTLGAALSLLTGTLVLTQGVGPWLAIAITFCYGVIHAFDMPARQSLVYDLTHREILMNALSLNEIGRRATTVVGPLAAGVLIEAIGIGRVFLLMATLSALGLAALAPIVTPLRPRQAGEESALRDLVEGVRVIGRNQVTATLLVMAIGCEIFAFSYASMMPIFADKVLGVHASGYGYLTAAAGLGAFTGAIVLASLGEFRHKGWLLTGAFLLFGVFLLAFSSSGWFVLSLVLLVGVGMMSVTFDTMEHTLLQKNVPEEMRGRAVGAWVLSIGMGPVGTMYLGLVADRIGAPLAVGINGAIVSVLALAVLVGLPRVRRLG